MAVIAFGAAISGRTNSPVEAAGGHSRSREVHIDFEI